MSTHHRSTARSHSALILIAAVVSILLGCASDPGSAPQGAEHDVKEADMVDVTGDWAGSIDVGGQKLPLVFHITRGEDGLSATMDSPKQGAAGIPAQVEWIEGSLEVTVPQAGIRYTGTPNESGDRIEGTFTQGGTELDLVLTPIQESGETEQADAIPHPESSRRPQDPAPPYPYVSEDVTFTNSDAGVELAGTITRPEGPGPFPAAVLVSGSGQQNRNEEIFGHRPFLVLADALTRSGVAVLRYDDRGVGESGGGETVADATSRDFAGDASYALRYLMEQSYVDPDRAGMIGHSEGALIAAMIAAGVEEVPTGVKPLPIAVDPAFVVMLAGEAVPGDELLMMQSAAILRASGTPEDTIDAVAAANRRIYDIVLSELPREQAAEQVAEIMRGLGLPPDQIDGQLPVLFSPWYEFFLRYDPADALRQIDVPVLAIIGSLDSQVPAEQNIPRLRDTLSEAPTDDFRVMELEGLNHLLQPAETGGIQEYGRIETTIAPEALETVTSWINERFAK